MAFPNARFGAGSGAIVMDNVACTGTEERLVYCPFDRHTGDCYHTQDAGLRCPNLTRMLHKKYTHTHTHTRVYEYMHGFIHCPATLSNSLKVNMCRKCKHLETWSANIIFLQPYPLTSPFRSQEVFTAIFILLYVSQFSTLNCIVLIFHSTLSAWRCPTE